MDFAITVLALPVWLAATLIIALPTALSGALVYVVRRRWSTPALTANNDFAAVTYPVIGVVYGVFLAFAIIVAWQRFTDAEQSTVDEVSSLSDVVRDAQVFPEGVRLDVRDRVRRYLTLVRDREWAKMGRGQADAETSAAFVGIWDAYYAFQPEGPRQEAFYEKGLDQLNGAARHREQRVLYSTADTPDALWWFLVVGAVICMSFSYAVASQDVHLHAATSAAIAWLLSFGLFLVMNLQYPFAGDVAISNAPYVALLSSIEAGQ